MPKELCVQWWCTAPISGGARRDWGAQLVAQMFSFLETVRLQGQEAIAQLYQLLCESWSQSTRFTVLLHFLLISPGVIQPIFIKPIFGLRKILALFPIPQLLLR